MSSVVAEESRSKKLKQIAVSCLKLGTIGFGGIAGMVAGICYITPAMSICLLLGYFYQRYSASERSAFYFWYQAGYYSIGNWNRVAAG